MWFDELTLQYADLDTQRLAAQEYGAHVVEWDDYLNRCSAPSFPIGACTRLILVR